MSCLQELFISYNYILSYQIAESLCLNAYLSCLYAEVFFQNYILSRLCVVLSCNKLTIHVVWCLFNVSCRNCRLSCLFSMLLCRNTMLSSIFAMKSCRNTRLSYFLPCYYVETLCYPVYLPCYRVERLCYPVYCSVIVSKHYAILSIYCVIVSNTLLNDSYKIPPLIG